MIQLNRFLDPAHTGRPALADDEVKKRLWTQKSVGAAAEKERLGLVHRRDRFTVFS